MKDLNSLRPDEGDLAQPSLSILRYSQEAADSYLVWRHFPPWEVETPAKSCSSSFLYLLIALSGSKNRESLEPLTDLLAAFNSFMDVVLSASSPRHFQLHL